MCSLKKLPGTQGVNGIRIKNRLIESISLKHTKTGSLKLQRLAVKDAPALFDFYFRGLSKKSRRLFPPYPLFSPAPVNTRELTQKIKNWQKESDWTVLKLTKARRIIGICLLKRYASKRPTSGLAVREKFKRRGLGTLLQTVINHQAALLKLKRITVTLAKDNTASLKVHEKCGFKKTSRSVPHYAYKKGKKVIDRYDMEMIKDIGRE